MISYLAHFSLTFGLILHICQYSLNSMADIPDGQQQYIHHTPHQQHQGQEFGQGMTSVNGALGLSLNQYSAGSSTRPSTPSNLLYPHSQAHSGQQGFPAFSPSGNMAIIPNISSGLSTSSRPSTAASSLSLSHSLRRSSAGGSRPSTAGSLIGTASGHSYMHRPASSGSGTVTNDFAPLGYSPFSFQGRNPADVSLDDVNAMGGGYTNTGISRPSTASSAPSAAPSPYMRQGTISLGDGATTNGMGGMGRWQESPMLAQPQPHTVDGLGVNGYFNQLMHSSPQPARMDSPAWAC